MPRKDKEARRAYNAMYKAENVKRIRFDAKKDYYADILEPLHDITGLPLSTFIKQAIAEKIERDGIDLPIGKYL